VVRSVRHNFVGTVVGACGHVCDAWPCVRLLGEHTSVYECRVCTIDAFGRERWEQEGVAVWVAAKVPTWEEELEDKERKAVRKKSVRPRRTTKGVYVPVRKDGLW
jgi:hypothetical protein